MKKQMKIVDALQEKVTAFLPESVQSTFAKVDDFRETSAENAAVWKVATQEKIAEMKWKTFGCGSAIASTSMFSTMVTESGGMGIDEALKIKPQDVMKRLDGLPNRKIHCSVLADKAFRKTVNEYFRNTGQHDRVITEGSRVVDKQLNITDHDIELACQRDK
jgi:hypothetical protein